MYRTVKKNPIYLIGYDEGVITEFPNLDSLIDCWNRIWRLNININFCYDKADWDIWNHKWIPSRHYGYILRTSTDEIVDPDDIKREYSRRNPRPIPYWRRPVTGAKRRWRFRHFYKMSCSMNERRQVESWEDDEDAPKVRAKRNLRHLPNAWNDVQLARNGDHCWKRTRKTQWK